jgi:hypothetical protein
VIVFANLIHYAVDLAPHGRIVGAPRRQAAQMRDNDPGDVVDGFIEILPAQLLALLLHQPRLQHLGLDPDVFGIGPTARRLPPLPTQVSYIGKAALVEREAITLPLDHAFGFDAIGVIVTAPIVLKLQRRKQQDHRGILEGTSKRGGGGNGGAGCQGG